MDKQATRQPGNEATRAELVRLRLQCRVALIVGAAGLLLGFVCLVLATRQPSHIKAEVIEARSFEVKGPRGEFGGKLFWMDDKERGIGHARLVFGHASRLRDDQMHGELCGPGSLFIVNEGLFRRDGGTGQFVPILPLDEVTLRYMDRPGFAPAFP